MSWSTASTKLAAVYAGLGFVVTTRETELIELNNRINLRYFVSQTSTVRPSLDRDLLREHWENGGLAQLDRFHPFLCGMAAVRNMASLLRWQDVGTRLRLALKGALYEYEPGEEDSRLTLAKECIRSKDLPLMAAMGTLGFPVIDTEGSPPRRLYVMPNTGLDPLQRKAVDLVKRADPAKLPLALETENPEHPLCLAYNGAYAFARMNAHIRSLERNVLLKAPGSNRRALVPENPSDALLDEVGRHFRIC
jgi:hypothetical protein